ncbi:MAG: signal peptidase II [Pseudomonadota bacterium]
MSGGETTAPSLAARRYVGLGLGVALAIILADQASKWFILLEVMQPPQIIPVTSFFNLVLVWNQGVSFGLLATSADMMRWALTGLAVAVSIGLLVWLWRCDSRLTALALGGIIGGALGNAIDRVIHGAVVDFLDVHAAGYHWPAFNLADSAITVAAVTLVVQSFFTSPDGTNGASANGK